MKGLYRLHFDCGKNGVLEGLFIADVEEIDQLIESKEIVYFKDAPGMKEEIFGPIEESDITLVSKDEKVLAVADFYKLLIGYNPLNYKRITENDLEDK